MSRIKEIYIIYICIIYKYVVGGVYGLGGVFGVFVLVCMVVIVLVISLRGEKDIVIILD